MEQNIYTISQIRGALTPLFNEYGIKKAILFGSYVKGEANEESDIDFCVDSGLRGLDFMLLVDEMSNLLKKDVDVFDVTHIKENSRIETEINKTGVVIYEK